MPVLPLVASTIVVRPGSIRPSRSAASTIATPIRSLTDPPGLNISSLPKIAPPPDGVMRVSWTIGVRPTCSAMLIGIRAIEARRSLGDDGMEAGLLGLFARLALDRDGLGGADGVALVGRDL